MTFSLVAIRSFRTRGVSALAWMRCCSVLFAKVRRGERALDLGCGNGILPLLLAAKYPGEHYAGLEIQEESAGMAVRSVKLNGLEEKNRYCDRRHQRSGFDLWSRFLKLLRPILRT